MGFGSALEALRASLLITLISLSHGSLFYSAKAVDDIQVALDSFLWGIPVPVGHFPCSGHAVWGSSFIGLIVRRKRICVVQM